MLKKTLNNKGVALVTVVLFFLVLVTLLAGVMFSSISNQGNAKLSKDHSSAYYVAESGLNISMERLRRFLIEGNYAEIPVGKYDEKITNLETFLTTNLHNSVGTLNGTSQVGNYLIRVEKSLSDPELYIFTSTGTVDGVSRTLAVEFKITKVMEELMKAVLAKNGINNADGGGGVIDGEVASLMETAGSVIKLSGCAIDAVTIPTGTPATIPNCTPAITVKPLGLPKPVFDSTAINTALLQYNDNPANLIDVVNNGSNVFTFPLLSGTQTGYKIDRLPNSNITFDLGLGAVNRIFELYVNDVDFADNLVGSINVTGNGKLIVIVDIDSNDTKKVTGVDGYYNWGWNVNNIPLLSDLSKFQLVVKRGTGFAANVDPTFTMPNNTIFVGSLLGNNINLFFGNIEFKGFIATLGKSITFKSVGDIAGPMWIYAPNAHVSVESGASINGAVMANSVSLTSNSSIVYESYTGTIPFNITLPTFAGGALYPVGITFQFINFKEV